MNRTVLFTIGTAIFFAVATAVFLYGLAVFRELQDRDETDTVLGTLSTPASRKPTDRHLRRGRAVMSTQVGNSATGAGNTLDAHGSAIAIARLRPYNLVAGSLHLAQAVADRRAGQRLLVAGRCHLHDGRRRGRTSVPKR